MKWLGGGDSNEMLGQANGHVPVNSQPQVVRPQPQQMMLGDMVARPRSQDDAMVGYVFQRPHADPEFPLPPGLAKQQPQRWALGDDTLIDHNHEKWKYPTVAKMQHPINSVPYELHPLVMKTGAEHLMFHQMGQPPPLPPPPHLAPAPGPAAPAPTIISHHDPRNGQIAPSAKKLWGVEEPKDEPKGILNLNEQMWRDSTWSTSEHAVSQPITMVARRSGSFPGSEAGNILSPRSSETSGLGVKMVEYVLGTSPTNKDLEPRMRGLMVAPSGDPTDKKDKEKGPSSPYDTANKKELENGVTQNGVQNGLDDDKAFNRTPGSRQPSPSDEDINKNTGGGTGGGGVVVLENPHVGHPLMGHTHHFPPPPHAPHALTHLSDSHFEHVMLDPNSFENYPGNPAGAGPGAPPQQPGSAPQQPGQQTIDSPSVLPQSFDVQIELSRLLCVDCFVYNIVPYLHMISTDSFLHEGGSHACAHSILRSSLLHPNLVILLLIEETFSSGSVAMRTRGILLKLAVIIPLFLLNRQRMFRCTPLINAEVIKLIILAGRVPVNQYRGRYNAPTTNEVTVLLVDEDNGLRCRDGLMQRVSDLSSLL
ncbi:uncharacterized protein LOC142333351 [Lycorma delicatula]|uniref:uncharacterized protein LOC142333351 n=1 Tax=Lycorma delicatula TaxID=130591 RepID=UPI003F517569